MLAFTARGLGIGLAISGCRQVTAMAKKQFYAVVMGKRPGLYRSWEECAAQVKNFPGNVYKGFGSEQDALQYLVSQGVSAAASGAQLASRRTAAIIVQQDDPAPDAPSTSGRTEEGAAVSQPLPTRLDPCGRTLRVEFDGASKRNPGPAGFGAVIYDDLTNIEVTRLCQYMGAMHTNNQAEYAGLIAGLQAALELGCEHVTVRGDSTLIIKQVLGQYRVKNEGLMPYHAAAVDLSRRFKSFAAHQVPREQNKVADALSNEAITNYYSGINPHIWTLAGNVKRKAGRAAEAGDTSPTHKKRRKAGVRSPAAT